MNCFRRPIQPFVCLVVKQAGQSNLGLFAPPRRTASLAALACNFLKLLLGAVGKVAGVVCRAAAGGLATLGSNLALLICQCNVEA